MRGPADWSGKKRARVFAHMLGHLAQEHGEDGVLRIPMSILEKPMRVGMDTEKDEDGNQVLLIVVDTDIID